MCVPIATRPEAAGLAVRFESRFSTRAVLAPGLLTAPVLRRIGPEHLTSAEERPLDSDVLETIEIAGQRVFSQHGHIRDLADLERSKPVLVPGQLMPAL